MGIPDHITCLLRNVYAGQEATVRTEHGTIDWFKIRKELWHDYILSSCLFNFYADYIMQNAGLDDSQTGIKIARRNNNLRHTDDTCLKRWGTKVPLDKILKRGWKSWLKTQYSKNEDHGICSHHFMANRWGNSGRIYFFELQNHCRWWLQPWN